VAVYCVSTVQEGAGLRGATTSTYAIHPTVGIAVDVCHATDTPGNDKKQLGDTRLGACPVLFRGPNISPRVLDALEDTARAHEIAVQVRGVPRATGTDANVMQLSRDGVATGLVGTRSPYGACSSVFGKDYISGGSSSGSAVLCHPQKPPQAALLA